MAIADHTPCFDQLTIERFWAKVRKTDTCWLWTASTRSKGYGAFCYRRHGKYVQGRAHIFSYELHKEEVPAGLFVLHACDNPACVNPDHLFLGTNQDNVNDMVRKGRHVAGGTHCGVNGAWKRGERHHASKLTPETVREIRQLHAGGGWSYSKLAARYGVGISAIQKIISRALWKHVE